MHGVSFVHIQHYYKIMIILTCFNLTSIIILNKIALPTLKIIKGMCCLVLMEITLLHNKVSGILV